MIALHSTSSDSETADVATNLALAFAEGGREQVALVVTPQPELDRLIDTLLEDTHRIIVDLGADGAVPGATDLLLRISWQGSLRRTRSLLIEPEAIGEEPDRP